MPKAFRQEPPPSAGHNYEADPQWRKKPLTPAQLQVSDVRLETLRADRGPMLEINERVTSSLVPSASFARAVEVKNPFEKQRFTNLEEDYGWLRYLRLQQEHGLGQSSGDSSFSADSAHSAHSGDSINPAKCRWIHCSSTFPEYLAGVLWGLSDVNQPEVVADSMRMLDAAIQRNTRFSKHGKYFAPFSQCLMPRTEGESKEIYPLLISVPFLDWTIQGPTPPLRFQVDRREGFLSSRSSAHILRSILQYYYRLEDTSDREGAQVFAKHKPWNTNRELDLKVRQWYGHYPTGLNVDELWILAVDAQHIVTFSSNQTWKSRWPPLQLTSRISDVSFRGIRNNYFRSNEQKEYTAITHVMACLSGAVGMMHRNFWPDIVLCLTDRYASRMGHLQYRLHRSPSTKLVMDLISCQEELNIVINITEQQINMAEDLQSTLDSLEAKTSANDAPTSPASRRRVSYGEFDESPRRLVTRRSTYRQLSTSVLSDPLAQLLDNLQRELADLRDLRDNTDRLVNRTIQLVNIRLEDHGKAILVFTVVTIVFLPLNFVSSFFGMNFSDIRDMAQTQWLFWAVAICVTVGVVSASLVLAFSGGALVEKIHMWRDARRGKTLTTTTVLRQIGANVGEHGFRVYGTDRDGWGGSSF